MNGQASTTNVTSDSLSETMTATNVNGTASIANCKSQSQTIMNGTASITNVTSESLSQTMAANNMNESASITNGESQSQTTNVNGTASVSNGESQSQIVAAIDPNLLIAAITGNIEPFRENAQHLEQMVTFTKNTILHVHISSRNLIPEFVDNVLEICPSLLLKVNDKGDTPLHVAAKRGHFNIVENLLQHARDQHQELEGELRADRQMLRMRNNDGKTALEEAVRHEKTEVVKILIKKAGTDFPYSVNSLDEMLYLAIMEGDYEMVVEVEKLRSYQSTVHIGNEEKATDENESAMTKAVMEKAVKMAMDERVKMAAIDEVVMNGGIPGTGSMDEILHIHIKSSRKPSPEFVAKVLYKYPSLALHLNANGDTPLHVAAKGGHSDIAKRLLEHARNNSQVLESGLSVEKQMLRMINSEYNTALHEAVQHGNFQVVEVLARADPDSSYSPNKSGQTPLYLAAARGNYQMVVAIVGNRDISGTQLEDAILHMHIQASWPSTKFVSEILDTYPSLLLQCNAQGDNPLHVAARSGHSNIAEFLLQFARDRCPVPEGEPSVDRQMLRMCNNERDKEMLRMCNNEGNTALHEAAQHDNIRMVEILTKADREFSYSPNKSGETPLHIAAARGNYEIVFAILENLKSHDVPGTQKSDKILHMHIKSSQISAKFVKEVVDKYPKLLLQVDKKGDAPLHIAAKRGHYDVAKVLINSAKSRLQEKDNGLRADLHMLRMKNNEQNTALHEAVRHGNTEVVEILTKADPSFLYLPNACGETPLYLAAARGNYEMVVTIVESCRFMAYNGPNKMTALHAVVIRAISGPKETTVLPGPKSAAQGGPRETTALLDPKSAAQGGPKETTALPDPKSTAQEGPHETTALRASKDPGYSILIMRKILEKDKSLTRAQDRYGWTPLHYAAYYGLKDQVSELLKYDKSSVQVADYQNKMTALHMAASQGYKDIIEEIIVKCVECCEKVDKRGRNVLHFAMLSLTKKELFDLLTNPLVGSLINKTDENGNTPLHIRAAAYRDSFFHIGDREACNSKNISVEDILNHGCHELEEEIHILFEDVGNGQYQKGVVCERKDDEYFKIRDERRKKYYDGLKEKKESHLLVATLIATVTFTAAFTLPGGYSSEKGSYQGIAILNKILAFRIFMIADTLAMTLSLSAVFVHFITSFQKFQRQEFLLTIALRLTILAMGTVVVAFVTGLYAVLEPSLWLAIATCCVGLSSFLLALWALCCGVFANWQPQIWRGRGSEEASCRNLLPTDIKKGN